MTLTRNVKIESLRGFQEKWGVYPIWGNPRYPAVQVRLGLFGIRLFSSDLHSNIPGLGYTEPTPYTTHQATTANYHYWSA